MLNTPHALTGAAVGLAVGDPWLGLLLGVLSHFALDLVPHWDPDPGSSFDLKGLRRYLPILIADGLLAILLTLLAMNAHPDRNLAVLLGAIGGVLPDWVEFGWRNLAGRSVPGLTALQEKAHLHQPGLVLGIGTQVVVILLLLPYLLG